MVINANMILALKLTFVIIVGLTMMGLASEDIPSLVKQAIPGVVLIKTYDSLGE